MKSSINLLNMLINWNLYSLQHTNIYPFFFSNLENKLQKLILEKINIKEILCKTNLIVLITSIF